MDCRDAEKYFQAYVDGEFDELERDEIEQHFKFCPHCQKRVQYLTWFKRETKRALPQTSAPSSLKLRIADELRREHRRSLPLSYKLAPALAVAAIFLAVFFWPHIEVSSPLVEAAVDRHMKQLPNDVRSTDYDQVKSFMQEKLNYAISIPRFEHEQKRLVLTGGRVGSLADGGSAYFEYMGRGKRYTMLIAPFNQARFQLAQAKMRQIGQKQFLVGRSHGYGVVLWHDGRNLYSMVGDDDEDNLVALASGSQEDF